MPSPQPRATGKRNDYLDLSDEEHDSRSNGGDAEQDRDAGYDSEAADTGKYSRSRRVEPARALGKRKRATHVPIDDAGDDHDEDDDDEEQRDSPEHDQDPTVSSPSPQHPQTSPPTEQHHHRRRPNPAPSSRPAKPGVVYLSRVPPFMKPSTLKSHLAPFGAVTRLYLTPEPAPSRRQRLRGGAGNRKRRYVDGWAEFASKRAAKVAAEALNTSTVGGRGWFRDDVWVVKYLRGFRWDDLTEQVRNERAEREGRLREEGRRGRREERAFVEGVSRGKMLEEMGKKKKTGVKEDGGGEDEEGGRRWRVRQNEVKRKSGGKDDSVEQPEEVKRVLSKIF